MSPLTVVDSFLWWRARRVSTKTFCVNVKTGRNVHGEKVYLVECQLRINFCDHSSFLPRDQNLCKLLSPPLSVKTFKLSAAYLVKMAMKLLFLNTSRESIRTA